MIRNVATILVARPPDQPILVLKARKGTFHAPWDAARAVAALKPRLPSEQLRFDIVVIDGEPSENPKLFGESSNASAYIRAVLASLTTLPWTASTLDW